MAKTWLLDADIRGAETVQHLIDLGAVQRYKIESFVDYEKACREILPVITPDDTVVLDTISSLANSTRGDFKLGTSVEDDLWGKRGQFFGADKNYLTAYEAAAQMIMRRLRNLWSREVDGKAPQIIVTCHQDEQTDPLTMMKKFAPALNNAFYQALMATATDVFPLTVQMDDELREDGTVRVPRDARVLYLKRTEQYVAKHRISREIAESLPGRMVDPTLPKLYKALGKRPSFLVIYAPPGAGKTTLAVSAAEAATAAATTTYTNNKKEAKA